MKLVIFDVDGTLTATNRVDNDCYRAALADVFGLEARPEDWHRLTHVTDSGILAGLLALKRGRGPSSEETARFQQAFFGALRSAYEKDPAAFAPIPGAVEAMAALADRTGWRAAVATGGFRESARFKLRAAGFDLGGIPLASADDHIDRVKIVRIALDRAQAALAGDQFRTVVSVGDGKWDVHAARELGFGFVGIGDVNRLKDWGAPAAISNMMPVKGFIELVESASVP